MLIPVYNEARTLPKILEKLAAFAIPGAETELVIVDDGSTDGSRPILESFEKTSPNVHLFFHGKNMGKGAAIRTALAQATGDVAVIQDADLEYDPDDLPVMLEVIRRGNADIVFGSRNLEANPRYSRIYYWGNMMLNLSVFLLYGKYVSDMETCYKMMRRNIFTRLNLSSNGFDIEPEITAKLLRLGHKIAEVPIRYNPRTRAEGKKITAFDGVIALWRLLCWRFAKISVENH